MKKVNFIFFICFWFSSSNSICLAQNVWQKTADHADSLRKAELYSISIPYYKKVIQACDSNSESFLKYKIRLGISYFLNKQSDLANNQYNDVLRLTIENPVSIYRAHALNNLGLIMDNYGDFNESITKYSEAKSLYIQLNDSLMYNLTQMNIGIIYKKQGNYLKALDFLTKAATGFEKRSNFFRLAQTYSSIGGIQEFLGESSKASNFHKKSLTIRQDLNDLSGVASCYNNLGGVFKSLEVLDSAIYYFTAAINLMKENDSRNLGIVKHNIAGCFAENNQSELARKYFQEAINFKLEIGDSNEIAISQNEFARFEIKEQQLKNAYTILSDARPYVARSESDKIKKNNADVWKNYYKNIQNPDSALYYFELSENFQQEINNTEYLAELAKLQESFESTSKDRTINDLSEKNIQKEKDLSVLNKIVDQLKSNIIAILFLAGFLLLAGFAFFRSQKHKTKHQKLQAKLAGIEEEKKRISMELHDAAGSTLKKIKFQLDGLIKVNQSEIPVSQVVPFIQKLNKVSNEIVVISHSLHHPDIEKYVFSDILEDMVFDWFDGGEEIFNNEMTAIRELNNLKTASKAHVYRCIQELLINIRQHTNADSVCINISAEEENIVIRVSDKGSIEKMIKYGSNGIGLKNLEERLKMMFGHFSIGPNKTNTGTTAILYIPLAENKDNEEEKSKSAYYRRPSSFFRFG